MYISQAHPLNKGISNPCACTHRLGGAAQAARTPPLLSRSSRGGAVVLLQDLLNQWMRQSGQDRAALTVDGDFGPKTAEAVRMFQREMALPDDGIAGPRTWDRFALAVGVPITLKGPASGTPTAVAGLGQNVREQFESSWTSCMNDYTAGFWTWLAGGTAGSIAYLKAAIIKGDRRILREIVRRARQLRLPPSIVRAMSRALAVTGAVVIAEWVAAAILGIFLGLAARCAGEVLFFGERAGL